MLSFRARVALSALTLLAGLAPSASGYHYSGNHLATLGLAVPRLYLVDATGPSWPVTAAAADWNASSAVDVYRVSSCPSSSYYCLPTVERSATTSPCSSTTYGVFTANVTSAGHFVRDSVFRIVLCNSTPVGDNRLKVACHESGHGLGLTHRFDSPQTSCMAQGLNHPTDGDGHDFGQLVTAYNH
jgi:hypothetical protein